jgi:hypothetical protein
MLYSINLIFIVKSVFDWFIILKVFRELNPLTAKVAKVLRKGRKDLNYMDLPLRSLRLLSVLCG